MAKRISLAIFFTAAVVMTLVGIRLASTRLPGDPTFLPYLWTLAGGIVAMGAWAVHVDYLRAVESGQPDVDPPEPFADGWFAVKPHRSLTETRRASTASALLLLGIGAAVFGHYAATSPSVQALALLAAFLWTALTARIAWGAMRSAATARRVGDAKLLIRPGHASPGSALAVRLQQTALAEVEMRGVEASLVAIRTLDTGNGDELKKIPLDRLALLSDVRRLQAGQPLSTEATFFIPREISDRGTLEFRLYVRTRLDGFDYMAWFPIPSHPPVTDDE